MHYMEYICAYACALISDMDCYPFFKPASICVYNRSCVLASHECLPIQMYLSTAETDVSSVGNNFTIARQCCGSNGSHKIYTRAVRAVHVIHTHTQTTVITLHVCAQSVNIAVDLYWMYMICIHKASRD